MADANFGMNRVGELIQGVFKILTDSPEGLPVRELLERMRIVVPPTDFEKSDYPSTPGVERYGKMIRFASIAPVKAGWLVKEKGKWYLTAEGKKAYVDFHRPSDLRQESRRLYLQWLGNRQETELELPESPGETVPTGRVAAASTLEEAEEAAWGEIEQYLQQINPYDFQKLVGALSRAMGYHIGWIAPAGPDRGIDIVAHKDPLGTSSPRIKVQVKRRADKITVEGLRAFMSLLGEQDVGIFVSTGGFTSDAQMEARTKETRKLTLVNLDQLVELWVGNYEKIAEAVIAAATTGLLLRSFSMMKFL